jgi:hypothetical protein
LKGGNLGIIRRTLDELNDNLAAAVRVDVIEHLIIRGVGTHLSEYVKIGSTVTPLMATLKTLWPAPVMPLMRR